MLLLDAIKWGASGIGLISVGYIIYRIIYRDFIRGYQNTKIWIRRNRTIIQNLVSQSREDNRDTSHQIRWINGKVFEALFTDAVSTLQVQIHLCRERITSLKSELESLDRVYDEKNQSIINAANDFWNKESSKYQQESDIAHNKIKETEQNIERLQKELSEEKDRLAEAETRKEYKSSNISGIKSKLDSYKEALPSAIQSVLSLWMVFLLLGIDFFFAHRSIEFITVQYAPFIQFIAATVLIVPLIALFEMIYSFIARNNNVIGKMTSFVTLGVCLLAAFSGIPDLIELRNGGTAGAAGHHLDAFVLRSLPIVAYLAAYYIYQWQQSSNRKDALIVILMYIAISVQLLFANISKVIFGSSGTSNPVTMKKAREIKQYQQEIGLIQNRIQEINNKLIPSVSRQRTVEIETKQKEALGLKNKDREMILNNIKKQENIIVRLENQINETKRGSGLACLRYLSTN